MTLFEQLKNIPKVDMHINLTSSISTNLASSLITKETIIDIEDEMRQKNAREYMNALKLPIEILMDDDKLVLALNDLIDQLISNNVLYGELFLDLPLYQPMVNEEKLLEKVLSVIKERKYTLEVVLVISSERNREDNLHTLDLLEKYYNKGVNGIYFYNDKMANLSDYMYLFDRLIRNNYPYIVNLNSKIANTNEEIYYHAKRIIYLNETIDDNFINECRKNNIMLEFGITKLKESNIIANIGNYFIYDLIKDNILLTIVSSDMTTMNTDILNEWCLLFNNYPLVLGDLVKITLNNLKNANISDKIKEQLILALKDKSNLIL